MSNYYRDPIERTARKNHHCVACGGIIKVGVQHMEQTGFYDGKGFRNRYHIQCFELMCDDGTPFDFVPSSIYYESVLSEIEEEKKTKTI